MNLKGCERKWSLPTFRNYPDICLEGLRIAINLSQSSQNLGKDLNSKQLEHKTDHSLTFSSDRQTDRQTEHQKPSFHIQGWSECTNLCVKTDFLFPVTIFSHICYIYEKVKLQISSTLLPVTSLQLIVACVSNM
jgi:hypothetical protein